MESKRFKEKIGDRAIILGLSSAAVLLALTEAIGRRLLSFPSRRTSLVKVLREIENRSSLPIQVQDYFEMLKEISGYNLRVILCRLEARGLIRRSAKGAELTRDGKQLIEKIGAKMKNFSEWDGKWRLVTFDVPEKLRHKRNWLRYLLKMYEFKQLHKSVFLGKFSLPEEVYKEIYKRGLGDYIRLLTVGEIDEESV